MLSPERLKWLADLGDEAREDPDTLEVLHDALLVESPDYQVAVDDADRVAAKTGLRHVVLFHPYRARRESQGFKPQAAYYADAGVTVLRHARVSPEGRGLSYPAATAVLLEGARIGPGAGWDVVDIELSDGQESAAYAFDLNLPPRYIASFSAEDLVDRREPPNPRGSFPGEPSGITRARLIRNAEAMDRARLRSQSHFATPFGWNTLKEVRSTRRGAGPEEWRHGLITYVTGLEPSGYMLTVYRGGPRR